MRIERTNVHEYMSNLVFRIICKRPPKSGRQIFQCHIMKFFFLYWTGTLLFQQKPYMARFIKWRYWYQQGYPGKMYKCYGKWVRNVCVFGIGDLHDLTHAPQLFVNKFHLDFHPLALDCMEELHFRKMRQEVLGLRKLKSTFYANLDFVKNHIWINESIVKLVKLIGWA